MDDRNELINRVSGKILDVGCNNNPEIHKRLIELAGAKGCHGIDLKNDKLKDVKNITIGNATRQLHEYYPKDQFDSIFAGEIIEHLFTPYNFLIGCEKVLKKGGKLFITTPNAHSFRYFFSSIFGGHNASKNDEHVYLWDLEVLERLVRLSGFDIIEAGYIKGGGVNKYLPQRFGWHLYLIAEVEE